MATHMIVFIIAAVVINILVYAGMSVVYFNDKHRVDPPKPTAESDATRSPRARQLDVAA